MDGVTSLANPNTYIDHAKNDLANQAERHTNRGRNAAQRHVDRHTGHPDVTDEALSHVTDHVRSAIG
ncbi:hypothetical protein ACIGT4_21520 [Streptomyces sioyaensis]|uniref:hypothetical protein n=1 Tax=Streptomyces sioyaensis TaxID=67364 RepID=UPI0037D3DCE3